VVLVDRETVEPELLSEAHRAQMALVERVTLLRVVEGVRVVDHRRVVPVPIPGDVEVVVVVEEVQLDVVDTCHAAGLLGLVSK
jgi:hypothetical protein